MRQGLENQFHRARAQIMAGTQIECFGCEAPVARAGDVCPLCQMELGTAHVAHGLVAHEQCEMCDQPAARHGLCADCEHPDDTDFYDYDPGEDYLND